MNILVVCQYGLYHDFGASFVHAQAREYVRLGHQVRAIVLLPIGKRDWDGKRFSDSRRTVDGVELYTMRHISFSNYGEKSLNKLFAYRSLHKKANALLEGFVPEIIHTHFLGTASEAGAWLKKRLGIPLAVTTHGSDTSVPLRQGRGSELKALCNHADAVTAVSTALAQKVRSCGTETRVSVILNGFNLQALPEHLEKAEGSIIQAGHLLEQKRFHITIRAFQQLQTDCPGAVLVLVGDGPEQKKLEALCQSLGLGGSVQFTGKIPNHEVLSKMGSSQFFVMPSVQEGFGIVYLEAMACGCIAIGTEGEGIADLIVSGENGFLVPPDQPETIAKTILWCLKHPKEASAIAQRGRQAALGLTWEKNAMQYISLFESLKERKCSQ